MAPNDFRPRAVFATAVADALKAFAAAGSKIVLASYTSPLMVGVAQEAVKAVAGALALPLLHAVLGVSDAIAARLDTLAREPFETGVRAAKEALALPGDAPDQIAYRENRLHFAIDNLERAWTLAGSRHTSDDDRFLIRLLQGSCANEVRGGKADARAKFGDCIALLKPKVVALDQEITRCRDAAKVHREAASNDPEGQRTGGWRLQGPEGASPLALSYMHAQKAADIEAEAQKHAAARDELAAIIALLQEI